MIKYTECTYIQKSSAWYIVGASKIVLEKLFRKEHRASEN